jgi:hypothetical protein
MRIIAVAFAAAVVPTTLGMPMRLIAVCFAMMSATWPTIPLIALATHRISLLGVGPLIIGVEMFAARAGLPLSGAILALGAVVPGLWALIEVAAGVRAAPGQGGGTYSDGPR